MENKAHAVAAGKSNSGDGIKLLLAWGLVGIPLIWGVVQTLINAVKAFQWRAFVPPRLDVEPLQRMLALVHGRGMRLFTMSAALKRRPPLAYYKSSYRVWPIFTVGFRRGRASLPPMTNYAQRSGSPSMSVQLTEG